jgi:hypothetical protein
MFGIMIIMKRIVVTPCSGLFGLWRAGRPRQVRTSALLTRRMSSHEIDTAS